MFRFYDAKATINGIRGYSSIKGDFFFKQTKEGVIVTAKILGLPSSNNICNNKIFAAHIHSGTSCTGNVNDPLADAKSHYNPNDCAHPHHAGDLEPLFENNGYAYYSFLTDRFKVDDIIGKVVIIHDKPDDFISQPSGNSGNKIACGVIKK